jgi:hypothetical protein
VDIHRVCRELFVDLNSENVEEIVGHKIITWLIDFECVAGIVTRCINSNKKIGIGELYIHRET